MLLAGRRTIRRLGFSGLAVVMLLTTPQGAEAVPLHARKHTKPHHTQPAPQQRFGSAAGKPQVVGESTNHVLPPTWRTRYPTTYTTGTGDQRNRGTLLPASPVQAPVKGAAKGFVPGLSREVADRRTQFERTFTNPDGSQTTEFSSSALNYRDGAGRWQPIVPSLTAAPDSVDRLEAAGGAATVQLDRTLDGSAPVARLAVDPDHSVGWSVVGAKRSRGRVAGATVTYPGFARDADLSLQVLTHGVKETVVLRSPDAPRTFTFPLQLKGLTPALVQQRVELRDGAGVVRAVIPAGLMTDSRRGAAGAVTSTGVRYRLVRVAGRSALRLDLDDAWLDDPRRTYPVRVDPTVEQRDATAALTVRDGDAFTGGDHFEVGPRAGNHAATYLAFPDISARLANHRIFGAQLSVVNFDAPSCTPRGVAVHPVTQAWSAANTALRYPGPSVGAALTSANYAYGYVGLGQSASKCAPQATLYDLGAGGRKLVQGWVTGTANNGLSLRATGSDLLSWKSFVGTSSANPPRLYVTHSAYGATYAVPNPTPSPPVLQNQNGKIKVVVTNTGAETWTPTTYYLAYRLYDSAGKIIVQQKAAAPTTNVARGSKVVLDATIKAVPQGVYTLDFTMVRTGGVVFIDELVPPARVRLQVFNIPPVLTELYPPNGHQSPTLSPQLWATAVDRDATAPGMTYQFVICPSTGTCVTSPWVATNAWTPPAGSLTWGKQYSWRVQSKDAQGQVGAQSAPLALFTKVPQPSVTSRLANGAVTSQEREFDPLVGNYATAAVDAPVTTVGPPLSISRTYNSLDPRVDGAFGAGWSTQYDMALRTEPDGSGNVLVTLADGQQARFGKNPDGTFTGPESRSTTLSWDATAMTWTMRERGGLTYVFSSSGRLSTVRAGVIQPLTLTYGANGKVSMVTSGVSGRYLKLTWGAAHVSSVAIGGTTSTWTYTYTGDHLTKVCAPDSSCTTYATTSGSRYRTAVLDAQPESYWRLGDDGATPDSASEVGVNLGKDRGTYVAATTGTAGALAGTPNTAVSLNATASASVALPAGSVKKSRDAAVELWFKAPITQVANPLLGYQSKALTATSTTGVPLLYVGSDGKLRGQFWTGTIAPITSTTMVNDNLWHHVVLSAMGATQTMYLDGASVGTLAGTPNQSSLTFAQLGASFASATTWPGYGTTQRRYFTGSLDEVALYSHPLPADVVAQHRRLGTKASTLTSKVTLPSGRTGAEIEYDTNSDRVAEYVDARGGSWKLGAPMVTGDADVLIRTVQVRDPADRPFIYEYDGITGHLRRSASPTGTSVRPEDNDQPSPTATGPKTCPLPAPGDPQFCTWDAGGGDPEFTVYSLDGLSVKSYIYDDAGQLTSVVNENGDPVDMAYDARGNMVARTTCRGKGRVDCSTTRYTFPTTFTDPLDPRWDLPLEMRDGRSASATDNTYRTAYSYSGQGDLVTQTNPDGSTVRTELTNGGQVSVDGVNMTPPGLPMTSTDPRGAVTRFGYHKTGDLGTVVEPSGLITRFTYDSQGRKVTQTETSDAFPNGVTTTFGYDALSRLVTITQPTTVDAVTGTEHQQVTTQTFDADGNIGRASVADVKSPTPTRTTTYEYDDHGQLAKVTDPNGSETTQGHDVYGNRTSMVDAEGSRWEYKFTTRNALAQVLLRDPDSAGDASARVVSSQSYDAAGRLALETDAMGRTVETKYYADDTVATKTMTEFHTDTGIRPYVIEANTYDGAGNLMRQVSGNGTATETFTRDAVGRVKTDQQGSATLKRQTSYTYDLGGNVTQLTTTGDASNIPSAPALTQTVQSVYDAAGRETAQWLTVGSDTIRSSTTYDQRGNVLSSTSPRGNVAGADKAAFTSDFTYDELGRPTVETAPPVSVEQDGAAATTQRPQTRTGYNVFGEATSVKGPRGDVSTTDYDARGLPVVSRGPAYTPPGASEPVQPESRMTYDGVGNLVEAKNSRGFTSRMTYDRQGRVITQDVPTTTDADRAVWRTSYTGTGEVLKTVSPTGIEVQNTYDDLDRQITTTQVERRPVLDNLTTRITYDDSGNGVTMTSPTGATVTNAYDALGQLLSTTDPNGVVQRYGYDSLGRQVRETDAKGRISHSTFDLADRLVAESDLDATSQLVRSQAYTYDVDGNLLTSRLGGGHTTQFTYDALGQVTQQVEPVSTGKTITTSFGYDVSGNRTRYTDGRGNSTFFGVNALGLPESVVEPSTAAHPAKADRTWTAVYDVGGLPVETRSPGGVARQRTYDAAGRMLTETGSGAEASTSGKKFTYDEEGRVVEVGSPAGKNTFGYSDRGQMISASGPSGTASYAFDGDGSLTQRVDQAGTADFAYTGGRLSAATDPITRQQQKLSYDTTGALSALDYGSGRVRSFAYDSLGRLSTDTLKNSSSATVASAAYEYDLDNHVTRKKTTGVQGAADNSYAYDEAGRLTSWTADGTTTGYEWDDSGNRVKAGDKVSRFDERNRLVSDGTFDYSYTARGTLLSKTTGSDTTSFSFDAFDRMISGAGSTYAYDDLDRTSTSSRGAAVKTLQYAGADDGVVSDGVQQFGRGPGGDLMSMAEGSTRRTVLSDMHGDVVGGFDPLDTALTALPDSRTYSPWGEVTATKGASYQLGFQGDWTDQSSGQVNMGARWYDPKSGTFDSRDTANYAAGPSSLANRYLYGAGDPVTMSDPTGNWPGENLWNKAKSGYHTATRAVGRAYGYTVGKAKDAYHYVADRAEEAYAFGMAAVNATLRTLGSAAKKVWAGGGALKDRIFGAAEQAKQTLGQGYRAAANYVGHKAEQAKQRIRQAKAKAYRAAVYVQQKTKSAIKKIAALNPMPALVAAGKMVYHGVKQVASAVANAPAALVALSVSVVKNARAATIAVYKAAVAAAGTVVQAVSTASSAVAEFAQDNWRTLVGVGAGLAVAVGCSVLTAGVGTAACLIAGAAVAGALSNSLNCQPGRSVAGCAARGAAAGAVGGAITVATGGVGGGVIVTALASGAGAAASDAAGQAITTGHVDGTEVATSGALGAVLGGAGAKLRAGCGKCFAKGTKVLTTKGRKAIEKIRTGDVVWAHNPITGKNVRAKVIGTMQRTATAMMVITVAGTALTVTTEHPFHTADRGWVQSDKLDVGDTLDLSNGKTATIQTVARYSAPTTVYNFTVKGEHNYFVGPAGVLVHNSGGSCGIGAGHGSAEEAADAALAAGRTSGAAAQLQVDGHLFTDISTGSGTRMWHDDVAAALERVPERQRAPWHGGCAEMGCLTQALDLGIDPAGGSVRAVAIGGSRPGHGLAKKLCSSCQNVMGQFEVGQ